jgi:hypothetical protein
LRMKKILEELSWQERGLFSVPKPLRASALMLPQTALKTSPTN